MKTNDPIMSAKEEAPLGVDPNNTNPLRRAELLSRFVSIQGILFLSLASNHPHLQHLQVRPRNSASPTNLCHHRSCPELREAFRRKRHGIGTWPFALIFTSRSWQHTRLLRFGFRILNRRTCLDTLRTVLGYTNSIQRRSSMFCCGGFCRRGCRTKGRLGLGRWLGAACA